MLDMGDLPAGNNTLTVAGYDKNGIVVTQVNATLVVADQLQFSLLASYGGQFNVPVADLRFIAGIPVSPTFTAVVSDLPLRDQYRNLLEIRIGTKTFPLDSNFEGLAR